jgi:NADPH:quinone reductase-like Zn-dependent oxidoreductase
LPRALRRRIIGGRFEDMHVTADIPATALQLRSLVKASGELELSLARIAVPEPGPNEVLVRIEASPINPSDLGLLIGPADPASARSAGSNDAPVLIADIPAKAMPFLAARQGEPMPVGNEGAGVVVRAGASEAAQALLGKTVAVLGGAMYAQYRALSVHECMELPAGTTPAEGASCFVNPLTALGMVETMRREGHMALVHTAAASNLGQMLNRICLKDGVGLVNVVRSQAQVETLRAQGAVHVVDTSAAGFKDDLGAALKATGATLAFDAVGGGRLASDILTAMEIAANQGAAYSRYGSTTHKQVYLYGVLDTRPTELLRNYGMAWGVGGWLLTPFLQKIGRADVPRLRQRVVAELKTTFASHYSHTISLRQALDPAVLAAYARRATGEKYLINPTL